MSNINITENVLTKYQDLVVQHYSSECSSRRGQWSSQSPGPPGLQNFGAGQIGIIFIASSSHDKHLAIMI